MEEQNVGRRRSNSLPSRPRPEITLPGNHSPITYVQEDVIPQHFRDLV